MYTMYIHIEYPVRIYLAGTRNEMGCLAVAVVDFRTNHDDHRLACRVKTATRLGWRLESKISLLVFDGCLVRESFRLWDSVYG